MDMEDLNEFTSLKKTPTVSKACKGRLSETYDFSAKLSHRLGTLKLSGKQEQTESQMQMMNVLVLPSKSNENNSPKSIRTVNSSLNLTGVMRTHASINPKEVGGTTLGEE